MCGGRGGAGERVIRGWVWEVMGDDCGGYGCEKGGHAVHFVSR